MAVVGYLVLVAGLITAFYVQAQHDEALEQQQQRVNEQICAEINQLRAALVDVQRSRQPLPTPEGASSAVRQSIQAYNARQAEHLDRFERRLRRLDCSEGNPLE